MLKSVIVAFVPTAILGIVFYKVIKNYIREVTERPTASI